MPYYSNGRQRPEIHTPLPKGKPVIFVIVDSRGLFVGAYDRMEKVLLVVDEHPYMCRVYETTVA